MAPDNGLEESEEQALRDLDHPPSVLDLGPDELEDLQENLEGEDDSIDPNLPEDLVEVVQARAIRRLRGTDNEPHFPDTRVGEFIEEKAEAFHMSRVVITQGGDEEGDGVDQIDDIEEGDIIEGELVEVGEEVHEQEELQAAHVPEKTFAFKLGGKQYA